MYVYLYVCIYYLDLSPERSRKQKYLINSKHTYPWFLIPLSNNREQGCLEKKLILGLGQGKDKKNTGHLTIPVSEKVLKKKWCKHITDTQDLD